MLMSWSLASASAAVSNRSTGGDVPSERLAPSTSSPVSVDDPRPRRASRAEGVRPCPANPKGQSRRPVERRSAIGVAAITHTPSISPEPVETRATVRRRRSDRRSRCRAERRLAPGPWAAPDASNVAAAPTSPGSRGRTVLTSRQCGCSHPAASIQRRPPLTLSRVDGSGPDRRWPDRDQALNIRWTDRALSAQQGWRRRCRRACRLRSGRSRHRCRGAAGGSWHELLR